MSNYIGNELTLFHNAKNWKIYFSKKILPLIKGDVLEVGAGIGGSTLYLNNGLNKSWTCLEVDKEFVAILKEKFNKINIIDYEVKELKNKFDTIIYIDVLEHIKNDKEELLYAKKHLNKNGNLIILVPAYNFLYNEFDIKIGHFRRYNKNKLKSLIPNELKIINFYYLDSMGFIAAFVNKLFLKKSMPTLNQIIFWDKILIPISKFIDFLIFNSFGKSLILIVKKK